MSRTTVAALYIAGLGLMTGAGAVGFNADPTDDLMVALAIAMLFVGLAVASAAVVGAWERMQG